MWGRVLTGVVVVLGLASVLARQGRKARVRNRGPMTPATGDSNPADRALGQPGANLDRRLDEALEESFPASDPVSVHIE